MSETARAVATARMEIATRLHDGPIQQLTAAQLFLDTALTQVDAASRQPMLERANEALREAIVACRSLMRDLAGEGEGP